MKFITLALIVFLNLNLSAHAITPTLDTQFSGEYGNFLVSYDLDSGRVKLADTENRKIYVANVKTGQEFPLDIDFLQFSRDRLIREYSDYLLSVTVSAQRNLTGSIDFIIKAKVNFDGGTEPQAVLIFSATSRVVKEPFRYYYNYVPGYANYELKGIESSLRFDRVEAPTGGPLSTSASIYKMLLTLASKLWPADGFHSTIYDGWWY